jgi:hypothetical protein
LPKNASPKAGTLANGQGYYVAAVSHEGKWFNEWRAPTWRLAIELAPRAKREFPSRLVFFSDGRHVWRMEEVE